MRYSNEEVFVVCSTYHRHHIKRRLIDQKLIEYKCCECGNEGIWMGKPLSLQLDHANGIANDNRLENLRFICANCHSQTDTYAGKNSKGMRVKDKEKFDYRHEKKKKDFEKWLSIKDDPELKIGEWGWKSRLADRLDISSQKVMKWLIRVDQEFAKSII
jgi:hypothetical protein